MSKASGGGASPAHLAHPERLLGPRDPRPGGRQREVAEEGEVEGGEQRHPDPLAVGEVPPVESLLAVPGAHVHLYGKSARPGRKLGHVTLVEPDRAALESALARIAAIVREPALERP